MELGVIKSISPLFIIDKEGKKYIKTPNNHKTSEKTYTPFKMSSIQTDTSHGKIHLPEKEEFNPKKTVDLSFVCTDDNSIAENLFDTDERVCITKDSNKDAFAKKCYCKLKDGYSFAVIAEFEGFELSDTVCFMGREKSSFILKAEPFEGEFEPNLPTDDAFYYAWSDLILKDKPAYNGFAAVSSDSLRVLKSEYENGRLHKRPWLREKRLPYK